VKRDGERFSERRIGILYDNDDGDDYYSHVYNCLYIVKYWICVYILYLKYVYVHIYINMCKYI
jgi:hypothetical protein